MCLKLGHMCSRWSLYCLFHIHILLTGLADPDLACCLFHRRLLLLLPSNHHCNCKPLSLIPRRILLDYIHLMSSDYIQFLGRVSGLCKILIRLLATNILIRRLVGLRLCQIYLNLHRIYSGSCCGAELVIERFLCCVWIIGNNCVDSVCKLNCHSIRIPIQTEC